MTMKTTNSGFRGYALVRDKEGRPIVDDLSTMPKEVWDDLSDEDKRYLTNGGNTPNSDS